MSLGELATHLPVAGVALADNNCRMRLSLLRSCCEISVALLPLLTVLSELSSSRRLATPISQQPLMNHLIRTQAVFETARRVRAKMALRRTLRCISFRSNVHVK